jgi:hypothetical protein
MEAQGIAANRGELLQEQDVAGGTFGLEEDPRDTACGVVDGGEEARRRPA